MATPFVIVGDAPDQRSGLSRILTDITTQLRDASTRRGWDLDIRTVGWAPWPNLPREGVEHAVPDAPPAWVYSDFASRGGPALHTAWRHWFGSQRGIVLTIWDAARIEAVAKADLPIYRWAYVPIDGENLPRQITGPAQAWLDRFDRVAAYTRFGAEFLHRGLSRTIAILPHGLAPAWAESAPHPGVAALFPDGHAVIGCVASNTRRKDLGLWARTLKALGPGYWGWLHTNQLVSDAWSVPQLIEDCDLERRVRVTLVTDPMWTDEALRAAYAACAATIAPGRGEGWGYPIMESNIQGRPAFHGAYAGGAEVAYPEDLITPLALPIEGIYGLKRPVVDPAAMAEAITQVIRHPNQVQPLAIDAARRRQHALQWLWPRVWPRWESWIADGLAAPGSDTPDEAEPKETIDG